MDHYASVLLAFPPDGGVDIAENDQYDKAVRAHLTRINKLFKDPASAVAVHAPLLLQHLDPAFNTISYLALLQVVADGDAKTDRLPEDLPDRLVDFLLTFDPRQIRYVGAVLDRFLTAIENGRLLPHAIAVEILARVILRIDPTGSVFTSHHLGLVRLAYATNNLEPALKVIDKSVVFYPGMTNQPEPKYLSDMRLPPSSYITKETGLAGQVRSHTVVEYDALCGLVYCARRDWEKAYSAFERAVTYPTKDNGVSRIMAEAHNRWVLVGLLLRGRAPSIPAHTGSAAQKVFQTLGKPYLEVAKSFESESAGALKNEVESLAQFWQEEGTTGLIKEVLGAFQRWQIVNLRDVYSKISLVEIRQRTQSAETGTNLEDDAELEALVGDMIDSGMLDGVIERPPGGGSGAAYLTFLASARELSEAQFAAEIEASARRIKNLEPIFKETSERLITSKDYVRHVIKEQKREKDMAARGPAEQFDLQVEDEDLMTGIMAG